MRSSKLFVLVFVFICLSVVMDKSNQYNKLFFLKAIGFCRTEFSGIHEGVIGQQPVQSGGGGEAAPRHGDRAPASTAQAATALLASGPGPGYTVTLYLQHGTVSLLSLILFLIKFYNFYV